jgi:hypothetical protein
MYDGGGHEERQDFYVKTDFEMVQRRCTYTCIYVKTPKLGLNKSLSGSACSPIYYSICTTASFLVKRFGRTSTLLLVTPYTL